MRTSVHVVTFAVVENVEAGQAVHSTQAPAVQTAEMNVPGEQRHGTQDTAELVLYNVKGVVHKQLLSDWSQTSGLSK